MRRDFEEENPSKLAYSRSLEGMRAHYPNRGVQDNKASKSSNRLSLPHRCDAWQRCLCEISDAAGVLDLALWAMKMHTGDVDANCMP